MEKGRMLEGRRGKEATSADIPYVLGIVHGDDDFEVERLLAPALGALTLLVYVCLLAV